MHIIYDHKNFYQSLWVFLQKFEKEKLWKYILLQIKWTNVILCMIIEKNAFQTQTFLAFYKFAICIKHTVNEFYYLYVMYWYVFPEWKILQNSAWIPPEGKVTSD